MPKGTDPQNIYRPHPLHDEELECFLTKGFLIRYCEEEAEINEVVMFRTELEMTSGF